MQELQTLLGYQFRDPALLELALTHPSASPARNNQRLEFLGDAALSALVAELLYHLFPTESEGELARRLTGLVRGERLTEEAQKLDLSRFLRMADGEAAGGGRFTASNLEDALEAVCGAIFLDGGYDAVRQVFGARWQELAKAQITPPKDAKSALQEWAQARAMPLPHYALISTKGPAHAPVFSVQVSLSDKQNASASANSKRLAEQLAAQALLDKIQE